MTIGPIVLSLIIFLKKDQFGCNNEYGSGKNFTCCSYDFSQNVIQILFFVSNENVMIISLQIVPMYSNVCNNDFRQR